MMKFNYKNKQYKLEEPTVEMWSKLVEKNRTYSYSLTPSELLSQGGNAA